MDGQPTGEKDPSLTNKIHRLSTPARIVLPENQVLSPEVVENIPVAEDIARFRTELEQKVLWEGLPFRKWRQAYDQTLQEYPQILAYKPILDKVMFDVEVSRKWLDRAWKDAQSTKKKPKEKEILHPETADPEAAQKLFRKQFGFDPQEDVEAIKGAISLRFTVGDKDYRKLWGFEDEQEIDAAAHMVFHIYANFPVIVMRRKILEEEEPVETIVQSNLHHEVEHAKYAFIERVRHMYFYPFDLRLPKEIVGRLQRRHGKESEMEKLAKDEILAFFTVFESVEMKMKAYVTEQNQEEINRVTQEALTLFKEGLPQFFEEEGFYFQSHKKRHNPSDEEQKRYPRNARRGIDSLIQLCKLYRESEYKPKAGRMAINVLEQFPLHLWPAVVRLIEKRHNIEKSPQ